MLLVACAGLVPGRTEAAATAWVGSNRASIRLVTGVDGVGSGTTVPAGLEFRYGDGWHGYWRTPGDAGIAPQLDWAASQNLRGVIVAWPAPHRLEISGLQNAVYTGNVILPLTVTLATPGAPSRLALALDYAACANICVPVHAELALTLPRGGDAPSSEAAALAAARMTVPMTPDAAGLDIRQVAVTADGMAGRLTVVLHSLDTPLDHPDLFAELPDGGLAPAPTVTLSDHGHTASLTTPLPNGPLAGAPALTVVDGARAVEIPSIWAQSPSAGQSQGLTAILGIALLGGLILNAMPCVLPVLSLKLASVARHAGQRRRDIRLGFAFTALGILASFLVLAAALAGLKLFGATLGWGIQFQQPWFLTALAVVTVLFAANLFDWLPIGLPASASRLGNGAARSPHAESFLTGVFSTVLATPCSAPFVGTAVGFALSRGTGEIVAVFASLGLGMALPFTLVAALPELVAWLPRPGAWMVRVRQGLGILLLATAAWLVVVLWGVVGDVATAWITLLLFSMLTVQAWATRLYGFATGSRIGAATAGLAILAIASAAFSPTASVISATTRSWEAFDPNAIDRAVAAGRTVLVDVTARWCLTCKVNEVATLDATPVRSALRSAGTLRMRADWSRPDPAIAAYLQRFGRFGIPLDVVYGPRRPQGEALPELLTPAALLAALDRAGPATAAADAVP